MQTGTVKFFNKAKGFGFIKENGSGDEIFVHITGVKKGNELKENDRVSFEVEEGKKGLTAVNVEKQK